MIALYSFQTIRSTTCAQLPGRESVTPSLEQACSLAARRLGLCLEDRRHFLKIELLISRLGKSLALMEEVGAEYGGQQWARSAGSRCVLGQRKMAPNKNSN